MTGVAGVDPPDRVVLWVLAYNAEDALNEAAKGRIFTDSARAEIALERQMRRDRRRPRAGWPRPMRVAVSVVEGQT